MKGKLLFPLLLVLAIIPSSKTWSQDLHGIVINNIDRDQKCKKCIQAFAQKPKEVKFSINRVGYDLYFEINDKKWFDLVFKGEDDGLAIDVVLKDRYECGAERLPRSQIRGLLLKPIYSSKLKASLKEEGDGLYKVKVGEIPKGLAKNNDLEYNILFLGNKNLCQYYVTYNLDSYSWGLLDTGMYLDELTLGTKEIKSLKDQSHTIKNKTLKFIIPFKKNKSTYSQADIKPVYDSLRLTDFNIKALKIKAYSSIEGVPDRNVELQRLRANSIVKALQTFQTPTIKTEISTSENWVEFFNDIEGTKYESLKPLTKKEIRSKMTGAMSREMEYILKNHRKAVVEIELEKREDNKGLPLNELLAQFKKAIDDQDVIRANTLQNSIFQKLKTRESAAMVLQNMKIPKQEKFAKLINKNAAYKYILDETFALIAYNELLDIEKLKPKDAHIKYNLAALKIVLWRYNAIDIKESQLKKQITALKKYDIPNAFILRMMMNFHMVKAELAMNERDYSEKDKSVDFINKNYKKTKLSDYDYFSLAQFFSYYAHQDLAVQLLEKKVRSIDVDEDLLFYYLNLTLVDRALTQKPNYRTIMANASNINQKRFCDLFNSVEKEGVTFQLLENNLLRKTYCETCNN